MAASELLAPALLILGLFLINAAALFFILRARRKQDCETQELGDTEIGSFKSTSQ